MRPAPPQDPNLSDLAAQWLEARFPLLSDLEPLSHGGQKQVYSARHATHGDVVLKLVREGADADRVAREVLAVANIQSARIPRVLGHGEIEAPFGRRTWLLEQRVFGSTVRELLVQGPLQPTEVVTLGLQICEALVAAEAASIVHRDVKPDNIIRDSGGSYWLIDFGLARHLDLTALTATAAVFGVFTPGYAPIEQCLNHREAIDSRTDLFALGVTLFECATGSNPYRDQARDLSEVLERLRSQPLPRLRIDIPKGALLADLVSALTQASRVRRPASAKVVHEWLKDVAKQADLM